MKQLFWSSPYGIWNNKEEVQTIRTFEILKQSLWDLKLVYKCAILHKIKFWSSPYGIWNIGLHIHKMSILNDFEAVPMGFETSHADYIGMPSIDFEAVPMGFETSYQKVKNLRFVILKQSLWDLKLQTEEIEKCSFWFWSSPYGIWNLLQLPYHILQINFEAVPMGFETSVLPSNIDTIRNILKQSLWDLKLWGELGDIGAPPCILKQSLWDLKHIGRFNDYQNLDLILKQSLWDLKHWYSLSNGTGGKNFEAVSMGFETRFPCTCSQCQQILKQSLWDLKP